MCNIYSLRCECDAILVHVRFVSLVCQSAKPIGSTLNRLLFSLVHTMNLYVDVLYVTVLRSPCMYLCVCVSVSYVLVVRFACADIKFHEAILNHAITLHIAINESLLLHNTVLFFLAISLSLHLAVRFAFYLLHQNSDETHTKPKLA